MVSAVCEVLSDWEFCEVHFQIGCLKMSLTPIESGTASWKQQTSGALRVTA